VARIRQAKEESDLEYARIEQLRLRVAGLHEEKGQAEAARNSLKAQELIAAKSMTSLLGDLKLLEETKARGVIDLIEVA
jgi:hypothetical protein